MLLCVHLDYVLKKAQKWTDKNNHSFQELSMVLWNCEHSATVLLTPKLVNDPEITGAYLHRFSWLEDKEIGKLDLHGTT